MTTDAATEPLPAPAPTRLQLIKHLLDSHIAGAVATPRSNNLAHYRALAEGNRYYWLGLDLDDRWTDEQAVLKLMAERCGVDPDPERREGRDTIDPELTVDALERMALVLFKAVANRDRVMLATGHPGGLLLMHLAVAEALRLAGCEIVVPGDGLHADDGEVRHLGGVCVLHRGGSLVHTHSPEPMRQALRSLERSGSPLPDLVVADHGWAGCAAQRGIDTVAFADCNDPAMFVGEAESSILTAVPLDDNIGLHLYGPLTAYLLGAAGLAVVPLEEQTRTA